MAQKEDADLAEKRLRLINKELARLKSTKRSQKTKRHLYDYINSKATKNLEKLRKSLRHRILNTPMLGVLCANRNIKCEMTKRLKAKINLLGEDHLQELLKRIKESWISTHKNWGRNHTKSSYSLGLVFLVVCLDVSTPLVQLIVPNLKTSKQLTSPLSVLICGYSGC